MKALRRCSDSLGSGRNTHQVGILIRIPALSLECSTLSTGEAVVETREGGREEGCGGVWVGGRIMKL